MLEAATTSSCPVCKHDARPEGVNLGGYQLYHCSHCTVRFAPRAFSVPVDYDRVYQSAEYDSEQVRGLQFLDPEKIAEHPTYRSFFRQVHHFPRARLLDVGCGVGRFGHGAHARGWDVTGIDVSARAIESGRPFTPFPLRVATIEELGAVGERFDVVTAFEVLEHLSSPVEFLCTLQQVVLPGGQVFCTVPNWNSAFVRNSTRPDWLPPIHLLFFNPESLRTVAERSGLVGVTTGIIQSDPVPTDALRRARWLARRLLGRPQEPLGLWVHGRTAA
ncbi:MAG: methyltransferase domain-containing protein [Gemmatimonadota bacterium]|nr:methyltransferase domain-containing protein [Gemmatimonadota bacterium]